VKSRLVLDFSLSVFSFVLFAIAEFDGFSAATSIGQWSYLLKSQVNNAIFANDTPGGGPVGIELGAVFRLVAHPLIA
jgi:hypothetical protein